MNGTEVTWNTEAHCSRTWSPGAAARQTFIFLYCTTFTSFGTFRFCVKLKDSKVLVLSTNMTIVVHVGNHGEGKAKGRLLSSVYLGFWSQAACRQTLLSHFHLCSRSLCVSIVKQQRRQGQLFVLTDKTENEVGCEWRNAPV